MTIPFEYTDTFTTCVDCHQGTYVDYPDGVKRCRYCGEHQASPRTKPKATARKKTADE